ncbi:unnamed protein product [Mytilus coruscus]|uniref:Uncharacterized protein n=1 Tax=Mytilus coruscus TaxID=42192 RepID=A0A6J8C3K8_MYTCO|nr:unnamed protein product [Mytilus coruscus]
MASYLSSKKSLTVSNFEKINIVVTPEDKNDTHLGKAVIHDLREIVDKTKLLRTDGAKTATSIITASTNGSNIQNEKKKVLLAKKIGLPVQRISGGKKNTINRDSVKAYKPIPGIRSLHQVLNSEPEKLTVRYMSCYSCEECVNGNYNMCTNNAIGRKEVVPIRPDDKGTVDDDDDDENDNEYTMSDLIVEGTVLALYTDEENAEFYLLGASSCPEKLRTSEVDDWGVSFRKKHKNHSRTVLQIRLK